MVVSSVRGRVAAGYIYSLSQDQDPAQAAVPVLLQEYFKGIVSNAIL